MNNEKIAEFESLFSEIKREGADKLLEFVRKSDFFTAPASTKYHGTWDRIVDNRSGQRLGTQWNDILFRLRFSKRIWRRLIFAKFKLCVIIMIRRVYGHSGT